MKTISLSAALAFVLAVFASAPAQAQALRSWVSGVGDDLNPCTRTHPCKTFAGAISNTNANGEINCLDSGGFGSVTITKSITIDCNGTVGGISAGVITINGPSGITVHLRNLTLNGAGINAIGINILNAIRVNIENVVVSNNTQQGVRHASTWGGSMVVIKDSTISFNGGTGVAVLAAANSGLLLDNVVSKQNQFGVAVAANNHAIVSRSNFSNNFTAGVQSDVGGRVVVEDSMVNNNSSGIQFMGTGSVANTSVLFNGTAFTGGGTITTFGNNRAFGNTNLGQALVAAGGATTDLGQR